MSAKLIISYDGTPNDDDALALGKRLEAAGFTPALAYVRHSREFDPRIATLGRMQQSTYDQLATHEKLVFAKSDGGPRRMILGDASSAAGSLVRSAGTS